MSSGLTFFHPPVFSFSSIISQTKHRSIHFRDHSEFKFLSSCNFSSKTVPICKLLMDVEFYFVT